MIDWLLSRDPREAQLEAIRRSWRGVATKDSVDGPTFHRPIPGHTGMPAKGWGHLLEMRVGKTPTHLNEIALFRRDFGFKWHIVFAPNAFKEDWPIEAGKFGLDIPTFALESANRRKAQAWIDANQKHGGLISVNWEAAKSRDNMALLEQITGDKTTLGGDESISIKNPQSATTKSMLAFATLCAVRRIMTGKPITQGAHDLWAQLRFIGEIDGFMFHPFRGAFCQMGGFQGKKVIGVKNEDRLQTILARSTFNARKVDWLKTPGRDYAERKITLLPDQERAYRQMQDDFLVELANGSIVAADQIITKLIKMQQIASGFIIDEDGTTHEMMPLDKNPKIAEIRSMLENEIEGKVIIITHFTKSMDMLEAALAEYQPAVIRGEQWHKANGRPIVDEKARFNGDPRCRVIIGQDQAIRYGHTLMGSDEAGRCHTLLFHENTYSLNDRSQGEERPQGEGQQAPISIWDFVATREDYAPIRALQRKEDVAALLLRYDRSTGLLPPRPDAPA